MQDTWQVLKLKTNCFNCAHFCCLLIYLVLLLVWYLSRSDLDLIWALSLSCVCHFKSKSKHARLIHSTIHPSFSLNKKCLYKNCCLQRHDKLLWFLSIFITMNYCRIFINHWILERKKNKKMVGNCTKDQIKFRPQIYERSVWAWWHMANHLQ